MLLRHASPAAQIPAHLWHPISARVPCDATIDNTVNNPATTNVPMTLPINAGVRIEVFTR
jgi:hypothetical protein